MEAAPTPHDITAIPYFAGPPSPLAWALGVLFLVVLWFIRRRRVGEEPATPMLAPFVLVKAELDRLIGERQQRILTQQELERLSLLVRRYLSAGATAVEHMTANELRALASASGSETLTELLIRIAAIEEAKFQPRGAASVGSSDLQSLAARLSDYDGAASGRHEP